MTGEDVMRRKINLVLTVLAVLVVSLAYVVLPLSTSTSVLFSLQGSRQLPASDYYEGVDESATFRNVLIRPNETYVALYSNYDLGDGGQRNYGQLGYVWNWFSTGSVSFFLVNSTYWDGEYPVGGSLWEAINTTGSVNETKLPSSDGTNMGAGPTTQLHFRWVFWNQGDQNVRVRGDIERYMEPPEQTIGLLEDYPDCFYEEPEYLFWNETSESLDAPPIENQITAGYYEWNVSLTTSHFDANLCWTTAIMNSMTVQNKRLYLTNYNDPYGYDGNSSRMGDNIWMAFTTSYWGDGWHQIYISSRDTCDNSGEVIMAFYINQTTPHIEFYDSWVSDDRTNTGDSVVVGFKARWNDTLEDIEWGLCAEVYDGTRYYLLEYHPDGWTLTTSYDEVCKKNFTVVSVGYFGERYEFSGEEVLFEQTVESPEVIWDRIQIVQIVRETTTQLPKDYTLFAYIGVAGVVVIAVIALALLRRRRDIEEGVLSPWD